MGRGSADRAALPLTAASVPAPVPSTELPTVDLSLSDARIRGMAMSAARNEWGDVQESRKIAPGIWRCSTAGHGGYIALWPYCGDLRATLGELARYASTSWSQNGATAVQAFAFEEDCDWAVLFALRPDIWEADCRDRMPSGTPYDRAIVRRYVVDQVTRVASFEPSLLQRLEDWEAVFGAAASPGIP